MLSFVVAIGSADLPHPIATTVNEAGSMRVTEDLISETKVQATSWHRS